MELLFQFRCNGSEDLAWVDHVLGIRETAHVDRALARDVIMSVHLLILYGLYSA